MQADLMKIKDLFAFQGILKARIRIYMEAPSIVPDCDALFARYMEICNQALAAHGEEFPYKQIWEAARNTAGAGEVRVALSGGGMQKTYALRLRDKYVEAMRAHGQNPTFRFNLHYVRKVVEHPQEYIDSPAMLNWGWLKQAA